jgi:hypothetical protein
MPVTLALFLSLLVGTGLASAMFIQCPFSLYWHCIFVG